MKPEVAIRQLEKLWAEASDPLAIRTERQFESWRARVEDALNRAFDPHHPQREILNAFRKARSMEEARRIARGQGLPDVQGLTRYLHEAIYELSLLTGDMEPGDPCPFDSELWEHVEGLIDAEDWGKVASQTAIFVENQVRIWADHPKNAKGEDLVGKELWVRILGDGAEYRLGQRAGEQHGWLCLGLGFAQALSNVDRHRIQRRDDAIRYAFGVLGLGSLLLTQLRYEYDDALNEG